LLATLAALACICLLAGGAGAVWVYRTLIGEPPGQGTQAQRGYAATAPIIVALTRYHEAHGSYPDGLEALVPAELASVPAEVDSYPILYRRSADSYTLEFSYAGPGMNHCTYMPQTDWQCSGYY